MKKIVMTIAPVLVLAAGAGAFALLHWAKPEPEKKEESPRPMSVFVEDVERSDTDLRITTSGEVRARTEVDIVAQISGRIVEVSPEFVEGGVVTPDTALIRIEDTDYRLALSQAEVRVAEAEVRVQQALADADVARKQLRNASNASDLALKRPQVKEAETRLAAAKADLALAELNLSRTSITLPFEGRMLSTAVDIGQYVTPGTRLGRAFATDAVEVRIPLNDAQLTSLGLPIGFVASDNGLPVTLSTQIGGREHFWEGSLVRLDAAVDRNTRMVYGVARVDAPYTDHVSQNGMPLAVGLFVNAEIVGRRVQDAYVIPRTALRAGNKVFIVKDGRLAIRDVDVTHSTESEAIIGSGLSAEDKVIVSSIRNPIEGMALEAMRYTFDESAIADRHEPVSHGS